MRLVVVAVLVASSLTAGCGTVSKVQDVVDYVHETKKDLEARIEKGEAAALAKLDRLETQAFDTRAKIEPIIGNIDTDADGKVALKEAISAIGELAKRAPTDAAARDALTSRETYTGLGAAVVTALLGAVTLSLRRRNKELATK